eukprot:scaffold28442_cov49-Prasinocladus_malaysianus.AAC.1
MSFSVASFSDAYKAMANEKRLPSAKDLLPVRNVLHFGQFLPGCIRLHWALKRGPRSNVSTFLSGQISNQAVSQYNRHYTNQANRHVLGILTGQLINHSSSQSINAWVVSGMNGWMDYISIALDLDENLRAIGCEQFPLLPVLNFLSDIVCKMLVGSDAGGARGVPVAAVRPQHKERIRQHYRLGAPVGSRPGPANLYTAEKTWAGSRRPHARRKPNIAM